ncbi:hypothetical protein [Stenotrophomonas sp.]|uniref:hypothetical protein n=1 Tax=Stenotrophomonas sp. TaxID=69392 RepID=UPI0028B1082D|nr:hypothetical protein [Stenotrophomonas sp.]
MNINEIAEEGFYWRNRDGEWGIVRVERSDDSSSWGGSKFLIHVSGWDIPETVSENASAAFVGPLSPPEGM